MAKETAAQRKTRIGMLLADYDDKIRQQRKLAADIKALKAEIEKVPNGTYGDFIRSEGTPREILDQPKARDLLKLYGIDIPTVMTSAPIVVTPVAGRSVVITPVAGR